MKKLGYMAIPGMPKSKIEKVTYHICRIYDISIEEIKSKSRKREYVQPRQICMYILKKTLGTRTRYTDQFIGNFFGGLDRATVIYAAKTIEGYMDVDKEFKEEVEQIIKGLGL